MQFKNTSHPGLHHTQMKTSLKQKKNK